MRQTAETIRGDFDRIALLGDAGWNHNAYYHEFLLNQLPTCCQNVLEIGCGTGEFSRLLAGRAEQVAAIDLSAQMIRAAREKSKNYPNINFIEGDALGYPFGDAEFDAVATLTTLHHLPLAEILRRIKQALKPSGMFVALDLYQRESFSDWLFDAAAFPSSMLLSLVKTAKLRPPKAIREAYAAHGQTDTYLTLTQIRNTCAEILPGAIVCRHLLWRYSIVWKKEDRNQ